MTSGTTASRCWRCLGLLAGGTVFFSTCQTSVSLPGISMDVSPAGFFLDVPFVDLEVGPDGVFLETPGVDVNIRPR